jgi:hypothetical protein
MRTASPVAAGEALRGATEHRRRIGSHAMDRRDSARAEELNNLRLALATFALQLDAFELRISEGLLKGGRKPKTGMTAWAPTWACGPTPSQPLQGRNHWPSINSNGDRSEG